MPHFLFLKAQSHLYRCTLGCTQWSVKRLGSLISGPSCLPSFAADERDTTTPPPRYNQSRQVYQENIRDLLDLDSYAAKVARGSPKGRKGSTTVSPVGSEKSEGKFNDGGGSGRGKPTIRENKASRLKKMAVNFSQGRLWIREAGARGQGRAAGRFAGPRVPRVR